MATKAIHLKLPKKLFVEISEVKEEFGFLNVQEFLKEAARKALHEYKKQKALETLKKNFGSMKGKIKRLTDDERDKLARDLAANLDEQKELFKRFGFTKTREKQR
jgi:metal-responsive CopG/Arc/MetJ family transcriptional regulator